MEYMIGAKEAADKFFGYCDEAFARSQRDKLIENFREDDYVERPEYNALRRLNAIDDLLDIICPTIDVIEALEHGNDEERQLFWDYESQLNELRKLREMLEEDLAEADRDYMNNKEYFDALDD